MTTKPELQQLINQYQNKYQLLFHGSNKLFDPANIKPSNPYDNSMIHGHADGYGIYLTTNLDTALAYGQYVYIYVFNINHQDVHALSQTERNLSNQLYRDLLIKLNQDDEFLSSYGDVNWDGINNVLNTAMNDLDDNDVDNINSMIHAGANPDVIVNALHQAHFSYTKNLENDDQIIIYDKKLITPWNVIDNKLTNPIKIERWDYE